MNEYKKLLTSAPKKVRRRILRKLGEILELPPTQASFRRYLVEYGCFKDHRTLAQILWLLAGPLDHLRQGEVEVGTAQLMILFMALEQVTIDSGRWTNALLFMQARDAPWSHLLRAPQQPEADDQKRKYSPLAADEWVAAITSFKKDQRVIAKGA